MREAVIIDAVRTPIGKYAGALRDVRPDDLLASMEKARELGLQPVARIVATAVAGVHPSNMGTGPVPAARIRAIFGEN